MALFCYQRSDLRTRALSLYQQEDLDVIGKPCLTRVTLPASHPILRDLLHSVASQVPPIVYLLFLPFPPLPCLALEPAQL